MGFWNLTCHIYEVYHMWHEGRLVSQNGFLQFYRYFFPQAVNIAFSPILTEEYASHMPGYLQLAEGITLWQKTSNMSDEYMPIIHQMHTYWFCLKAL